MSDKFPGGMITANAPAGFSVAFDGSGDYLTVASNANLILGTGAFTIEAWFYVSVGNTEGVLSSIDSGSGSFGIGIYFPTTTTFRVAIQSNSTGAANFDSTVTTGKWYHVAAVRDGSNNFSAFLNGTRLGTTTNTTNISLGAWGIARLYANSGSSYNGYISNVRIVKGTAVYDPTQTTINTPTQLFPITNTQLLTCQSPTIIDNSTNAFTVTANGNAAVSNFTPFAAYQGFNPALGAAAGGVWTLDEAAYYQNNRQWPIYDPYFNQTTLMLHGNGTNGAQNNTFLDSSTNNFTITRNGNTTQGSFSPFSQTGWSLYLPGSGTNYVQTPSSTTSALLGGSLTSLGSLSFTIECFINTPGNVFVVGACDPTGGTADMILSIDSNGLLQFGATFSGYTTRTSTGAAPLNTWCHVAWVVTGGYVYFYVNGAPAGSATVGNTAGSYSQLVFGGYNNSFTSKEYISNFRITKSALYTGGFTVPTSKLTATTNTTLLTFQDNNYRDNSANNYTMVVVGAPYIQAFSPFVPAYITPTTYSNWFDGSGDYFTSPSSAAYQFDSGDFTVEAWIYFNSVGNAQFASIPVVGALYWQYYAGVLDFGNNAGGSVQASWTPVAGRWYHVASVRNGATLTHYINGVVLGSGSAFNVTATGTLQVGYGGAGTFNGLFSNFRIVKGTAVYTAAFTPPTAPLTAISGTSLLACQSSTLIDNSTNNFTLTAYGNLQPVTSPTPFPAKVDTTTLNSAYSTSLIGGSAYFDGSGDYLTAANNAAFNLPADFTIECWWYPMDLSGSSNLFCIGDSRASYNGLLLYWSTGAGKLILYSNGANVVVSSLSTPINTWYHLAAVRSGSTVTFYINGASVGTATNTTTFTGLAGNGFAVGAEYYGTFDSSRKMYLTGSRLVKGTAVYTSNFAPPITPPTAVTNTQLLLNYTNGAIFDNTAKNVCETVGTAQISTAQSKWGGSSIKTDGSTSSWVLVPFNRNLDISTGAPDWTLECWAYVISFSNSPYLFNKGGVAATYYTNYSIVIPSSGAAYLALGNNGGETGYNFGTISTNTWYHFAATRQGNTIRTFLNGTLVTNTTLGTTMTDNGEALYIGCLKNLTSQVLNGYVDDLRITKGVARYTTNFTPPTSQLQDQ